MSNDGIKTHDGDKVAIFIFLNTQPFPNIGPNLH